MTPYLDRLLLSLPLLRKDDGLPDSVHVFSEHEIPAINAALATGRPLLLRGEPGTGKTQLGRAAAAALGWGFAYQAVDGLTDIHDAMWTFDPIARLAEAQVLGAANDKDSVHVATRLDLRNFIQPGLLWWAFDPSSAREQAERRAAGISAPKGALVSEPDSPPCGLPTGCSPCHLSTRGAPDYKAGIVALIDEIDKADPAVSNALLDALGHGGFSVPGLGRVGVGERRPLVILTTNEERSLPDAFLRRCLVLCLGMPKEGLMEWLVKRGRAHFPEVELRVLEEAARLLLEDRQEVLRRGLNPPGLAEYLDLVLAVVGQRPENAEEQEELLQEVRRFTLHKHPPEPPQ